MTTLVRKRCKYDPPHEHQYLDGWDFGGASGEDPRNDSRWKPSTYRYYDANLKQIYLTQTPICDDQAIDEFSKVVSFGSKYNPVYISVVRPGETEPSILPWKYDKKTDEVEEI
jgi:hypothetical protein